MATQSETATFGSGCFWCTEAVFMRLKGVMKVTSGYAGGHVDHPNYEAVCSGRTGHAEVVQVEFDPGIIPYETLVRVFFGTHDPTTMNRQGNDVGEQYRSVIFFHSDEQKKTAEAVKAELEREKTFDRPIITQIAPYTVFFPAEECHRNYYARNPDAGYCQAVISPKLTKFREKYREYLKKEAEQL